MREQLDNIPRFTCDAMLGGLARWLRAAGYDAEFDCQIDDHTLVMRARDTGRILLSSDGPMFDRNIIKNEIIQALFIPRQMSKLEQLMYVVQALHLPKRPSRCMSCGGQLYQVPKYSIMSEAPPLAYRCCDEFFRCRRCDKLFWHGTHWNKITRKLAQVFTPKRLPESNTPHSSC